MKDKRMTILLIAVIIFLGIVEYCVLLPNNEPKQPVHRVEGMKLIRKWEVQGIHCYVFVAGNDTLVAYSETDVNNQQQ